MEGRRYSDGLHQALEAKESVTVQAGEPDARLDHLPELFPPVSQARRHDRHGDDRGRRVRWKSTSWTWWRSPPTSPCIRNDEDDEVYRTATEKYEAVATLIEDARKRGQPVLVGTTSIEKSETISEHPEEEEGAARGAERALPRAGGEDRGAGGRAGGDDDRHQHGRPRHRHQTRRQPGDAAEDGAGRHRGPEPARGQGGGDPRRDRRQRTRR